MMRREPGLIWGWSYTLGPTTHYQTIFIMNLFQKKVSVGMHLVLNEFRNKTKLQKPSFILCQIRKTKQVFVLVIVYLLKYIDKWQGNYLNGCRQSMHQRITSKEAELRSQMANFILINNPKLYSYLWIAHSWKI